MARILRRVIPVLGMLVLATQSKATWLATGNLLNQSHTTLSSPTEKVVTASDGSGGVFVAWFDGRGSGDDLYLQHLDAAGNVVSGWPSNGLAVCNVSEPGSRSNATAVADGSGGVFLVWDEKRTGADQVFAQHILGNGSIAPGSWVANGLNITTSGSPILPFGGYNDPSAAATSDGQGGFLVAWSENRPGVTGCYAIFCQRITSAGAVAPNWTPGGQRITFGSVDQTHPMIVGPPAGGELFPGQSMIAWMDAEYSSTYIYVQALNESGGPGTNWPPGGVYVVAALNGLETIDLQAVSSYGGIIVVYKHQLFINNFPPLSELKAYRRSAYYFGSGDGIDTQLATEPVSDVIADANGFVAWNEEPSSGIPIVKLQLMAYGTPGNVWPSFPRYGLALASQPSPQPIAMASRQTINNTRDVVVAVPATPGGAMAYGVSDNAQSLPGWPSYPGLNFVGLTGGTVLQASLVRDPSGGALIGWADPRLIVGTYAQFVSTAGVVAADLVAPGTPQAYSQSGCNGNFITWTNTGDDGAVGQATSYQIRRSSTAITSESAWNAATYLASGAPLGSGQMQTYEDLLGPCSDRYYYAVKLVDDAGNWSGPGGTTSWAKTYCPGPDDPPCMDDATVQLEGGGSGPEPTSLDLVRGTPTILRGPTRIQFQIPRSLRGNSLSLEIMDLTGRIARRIDLGIANDKIATASWDLRHDDGRSAAAGVYFMRAHIGQTTITRRFVVL